MTRLMRQILALALAGIVIIAPVADAQNSKSVAWIAPTFPADLGTAPQDGSLMWPMVQGLLETFNVSFDQYQPGSYNVGSSTEKGLLTWYARTGRFTRGRGSADSSYTTYNVVLTAPSLMGVSGMTYPAQYRPDSITRVAKYPLVTQVHLGVNNAGNGFNLNTSPTVACSLGTQQNANVTIPNMGQGGVIKQLTTGLVWSRHIDAGQPLRPAAATGGERVLLSYQYNARRKYNLSAGNSQYGGGGCVDCDSTMFPATTDTGQAWVSLNSHITGAKPIVCAVVTEDTDAQFDPVVALVALSYADSGTGAVFGPYPQKAYAAIHVLGAGRRGIQVAAGGMAPHDETVTFAAYDSIDALGVPWGIGVNTDSIESTTCANELAKLRSLKNAHFFPYNTTTLNDSTAAGLSNASASARLIDAYGHFRKRIFVGDNSFAGADTGAVASILRRQYAEIARIFGKDKVDYTAVPPYEDMAPVSQSRRYASPESLALALRTAGAHNLVVNTDCLPCTPAFPTTNLLGYWNQEGWVSSAGLGRFPVVATPGYDDSGSAFREMGVANAGTDRKYSPWQRAALFQRGHLTGHQRMGSVYKPGYAGHFTPGTIGATDSLALDGRVHVFTVWASDLGSGDTSGGSQSRPTRPGWWQIKYLVNSYRAVNAQDGRQLLNFVYSQDLIP